MVSRYDIVSEVTTHALSQRLILFTTRHSRFLATALTCHPITVRPVLTHRILVTLRGELWHCNRCWIGWPTVGSRRGYWVIVSCRRPRCGVATRDCGLLRGWLGSYSMPGLISASVSQRYMSRKAV